MYIYIYMYSCIDIYIYIHGGMACTGRVEHSTFPLRIVILARE